MCKGMDVSTVDCSDPADNPRVEVQGLVKLRRGAARRLGLRRPLAQWLVSVDPAAGEAHWFRQTPDGRLISEVRRWPTDVALVASVVQRSAGRMLRDVSRMPVRRLIGNEPLVRCRVFPEVALRGRCVGCEACPLAMQGE